MSGDQRPVSDATRLMTHPAVESLKDLTKNQGEGRPACAVKQGPTARLIANHERITASALGLMTTTNHDYAGASGDTPFRNFQMAENLGVCSTEAGIILRMGDKLQRLATFANDGKLKVKGETTLDAVLDIINYAILLQTYIEEHNE